MATILYLDIDKDSRQLLFAISDTEDLDYAVSAGLVPIEGKVNRESVLAAAAEPYRKVKRYDPKYLSVTSHESAGLIDVRGIDASHITEQLADFMNEQRENFGFDGDVVTAAKLYAAHGRQALSNENLGRQRKQGINVVLDYDRSGKDALFSIVWGFAKNEKSLWNKRVPVASLGEETLSKLHERSLGLVAHCQNKYPDRQVNLLVTPALFKKLPVHRINNGLMLSSDCSVVDVARKAHMLKPYGGSPYKKSVDGAWSARSEEMYVFSQAANSIASIELFSVGESIAAYLDVKVDDIHVKRERISSFYRHDALKQLVDNKLERVVGAEHFRELHVPNLDEFLTMYDSNNVRPVGGSDYSPLPYDFSMPLKSGADKRLIIADTSDVFASRYITGSLTYDTRSGDVVTGVTENHATSNARTASLLAMAEQVSAMHAEGVKSSDIVLVAKDRLVRSALKLLTCGRHDIEPEGVWDFVLNYQSKNKGEQLFRDGLVNYLRMHREHLTKRLAFLFDVDGVISRWLSGLPSFLESKKLPNQHVIDVIKSNQFLCLKELFSTDDADLAKRLLDEYNSSDAIAELEAMDSLTGEVLKEISNYGDLIAVTCIGECLRSHQNRIKNLELICGEPLFSEVHCLDFDVSKEEVIKGISERRKWLSLLMTELSM